jgi:hypothetical protein
MINILNFFIDFVRLKLILRIEKNFTTSFSYNEKIGEIEFKSDITPIITKYYEQIDTIKKHNIYKFKRNSFTELESILIHAFTGDGSLHINDKLSSFKPKLNLHEKILVKVFDNVLNKIEKSTSEFVYRMDMHSNYYVENAIKFFTNNTTKIINIPWFLSTTEHSDPWGTKIVWKIRLLCNNKTRAKTFYPLINNHGDEKEIRFARNTKFRINSIVEVKGIDTDSNYYIIEMDESSSKKFDLNLFSNSYL